MDHSHGRSLADVLPSCAAALGIEGFTDTLGVGECEFAVVVLVDGLGATLIEAHPDAFPVLRQARGGSIDSAFPSTTATGIATLGTGLPSGLHGIVGASFYLPEIDDMLAPLHWGSDPAPVMVQPEPTVFEAIAASGRQSSAIGSVSYAGSGLTKAALRGADYVAAEDLNDRVSAVRRAGEAGPGLAYVYWPALDRAGHEFGTSSQNWRRAAQDVNDLLEALVGALPRNARLVVTADHGMVECTERIWIEEEPSLTWGVRRVGGEPRARHLYCDEGSVPDVHRRWCDHLGDRVQMWTRGEAIAEGLFGPVDEALVERIGDVVVVSEGGVCLGSSLTDPRLSALPGQHGGRSSDEMRIPGLIVDG